MLIYVTEPEEIDKSALDLLKKNGHDLIVKEPSEDKKKDVEVLFIRTYTTLDKNFLELYPAVKYILRAGVGLDNIDLTFCKEKNIQVLNSPGSNANAVSEYLVGTIVQLLRNINEQSELLRKGKWREKDLIGEELKGKTVGILGCGAIGKLLAKKLLSFEVTSILGYDPFLTAEQLAEHSIIKSDLDTIFSSCDIISLHLPLMKETRNMISLEQFKKMKKNSYIINTSRGGIINETDLITALKNKVIKGAALDVFENEPDINPELLTLENIMLTPHIAGYTKEADLQMSLAPVDRFLSLVK